MYIRQDFPPKSYDGGQAVSHSSEFLDFFGTSLQDFYEDFRSPDFVAMVVWCNTEHRCQRARSQFAPGSTLSDQEQCPVCSSYNSTFPVSKIAEINKIYCSNTNMVIFENNDVATFFSASAPEIMTSSTSQHEHSSLYDVKLHEMLDDATASKYSTIVSWMPHGKAFKVHRPKAFLDIIMPRYFKQSKYKSFQRQLHIYGFKRINSKNMMDFGAYYHEMFIRGDKDTSLMMQRQKTNEQKEIGGISDVEPDFYTGSSRSVPSKGPNALPRDYMVNTRTPVTNHESKTPEEPRFLSFESTRSDRVNDYQVERVGSSVARFHVSCDCKTEPPPLLVNLDEAQYFEGKRFFFVNENSRCYAERRKLSLFGSFRSPTCPDLQQTTSVDSTLSSGFYRLDSQSYPNLLSVHQRDTPSSFVVPRNASFSK